MIIASKQTIEKACKGSKLQKGGKCKGRGIMMKKRKMRGKNGAVQKTRIQEMKSGGKSDIHIKKNMEGTFTEWCKRHGHNSVTSACIQAGLSSSDPRIRKKANFARNSRSWHH